MLKHNDDGLRERKKQERPNEKTLVTPFPKSQDNNTEDTEETPTPPPPGAFKDDLGSILLLLLLYTLQGIPMGLSASIPFMLQSKVSYSEIATFSLVSWPFSLKILWAPIVDSVYSPSFGRRKSWLVPIQLAAGVLMTAGSYWVATFLGSTEGDTVTPPNIYALTAYFLTLYFLMATQDIAVDGWALTMLSKANVGYASTCNSVGQTLGYFIAYVGFLALNDPSTCNTYFRATSDADAVAGLVTLPQFLNFWGWVMLCTTVGIWGFKTETPERHPTCLGIRETYHQLACLTALPAIRWLSLILLTCKIGFAAAEAVAPLKLVEYGLEKEKLALLTPILIPLGIVLPVLLTRVGSTMSPWRMFLTGYPLRLAVGLLYAAIVYVTPHVMSAEGSEWRTSYYGVILAGGALHELASNMMFVSVMGFYATISDPAIGGTYMTALNTITNLGSKWPNSVSLALVETFTTQRCSLDDASSHASGNLNNWKTCGTPLIAGGTASGCELAGGTCAMDRDGFFVETVLCFAIGLVWLLLCSNRVLWLQNLKIEAWRVKL